MRFGDDQGPSCGGIRSSVGVNMAEEPDAWLNSVVRTLRGLFRNGETPPRVAIVVAFEHEPRASTLLPTPERVTSTEGERSTGSWDEVPETNEVVLPRSDLPRVIPASTYVELDDYCRPCGAGIVHRPGDPPRFWHTQ